jgi:predicted aconitase with swiveling domain
MMQGAESSEYATSQEKQARLRRVSRLSRLLDEWMRIPGTSYRVGLDSLIGLVPGVGDAAGAFLSSYILYEAIKLGVPTSTLIRMVGNIALETVVGSIPLVGDVFDMAWKANKKNVALIHAALKHV